MIYKPDLRNVHTVRLTFNDNGYEGHIAFKLGGNCKGARILSTGLEFLEDCSEDDIKNLVENDCNLWMHEDDRSVWFTLNLTNTEGEVLQEECDEDELEDLILSVDIIDCQPDE